MRSAVFYVCVLLLLGAQARAQDSASKPFRMGATFDYLQPVTMGSFAVAGGSAVPYAIGGNIQGQRFGGVIAYRPAAPVELSFQAGVILSPRISARADNAAVGDVDQIWAPDSAPYVGFGAEVNVLPKSIVQLRAGLRWLRGTMGGTEGTVSNPGTGCTYDFASNSASTCTTVGGFTGGGVMRSAFQWNLWDATVHLSIDLVGPDTAPLLTFGVGASENFWSLWGRSTYTPPAAGVTYAEQFSMIGNRTESLFVSLSSNPAPVSASVVFRFGGESSLLSSVSLSF